MNTQRSASQRASTLPSGTAQYEVQSAEKLMRREGIPYLDVTSKSIEELATAVLHQARLERKIYYQRPAKRIASEARGRMLYGSTLLKLT